MGARRLLLTPFLLLACAPSAAGAADWTCSATAISGTALGQPVGSATAGGPGTCAADDATLAALPTPLSATAVTARTLVAGSGAPRDRRNVASAGVTGLRVQVLPELPIRLPTTEVLQQLPPVSIDVPLLGRVAVDIRPAVEALLPDGRLPRLDLLSVDALMASAVSGCGPDGPARAGVPHVTGLKVLGLEVGLDDVTDLALNLNTARIDLSDIDVSKVVLPAGVTLPLSTLDGLLRPVLDALPTVSLPAALASVKVTPGGQETLPGGELVQRAARVQVSVAGTSLADLAIGEARVGDSGVDCAAPAVAPTATDLVLGCTERDVVLVDVVPMRSRVRLLGVADRRFAGRTVDIRFAATGRIVARPVVRPDGSFSAGTDLPSRRLRSSDRARYRASIGDERSLDLKLERRMRVFDVSSSGGRVTIDGQVIGPLAARESDRFITVERRVGCSRTEVVARLLPEDDGTFTARFLAPVGDRAAVYRLRTRVRGNRTNPKLFNTFTLPRPVDFGR